MWHKYTRVPLSVGDQFHRLPMEMETTDMMDSFPLLHPHEMVKSTTNWGAFCFKQTMISTLQAASGTAGMGVFLTQREQQELRGGVPRMWGGHGLRFYCKHFSFQRQSAKHVSHFAFHTFYFNFYLTLNGKVHCTPLVCCTFNNLMGMWEGLGKGLYTTSCPLYAH